MPLTARQPEVAQDSSPASDAGRKLGKREKALLWQWLQADPGCPSRALQAKLAETQPPVSVSLRQLNRLRVQWQLSRGKGRPRQDEAGASTRVTKTGGCRWD